jgi:hypothetical protein
MQFVSIIQTVSKILQSTGNNFEQQLHTLPEHMSSPAVFSGVRVTRSLILYVCFVGHCLCFFFWPIWEF